MLDFRYLAGAAPLDTLDAFGDFGLVSYQGSKRSLRTGIVDAMVQRFGPCARWPAFFDLCAGTAAIAREVMQRCPGLAAKTTVVDLGPWGAVWTALMRDRAAVIRHLRAVWPSGAGRGSACRAVVGRAPATDPLRYAAEFLALQGGSLYGRPPKGALGSPWRVTCVLPGPGRGVEPVIQQIEALPRFRAVHGKAEDVKFKQGDVVYVDPPYVQTTGYNGMEIDIPVVVRNALRAGAKIVVSHHTPYPGVTGLIVPVASVWDKGGAGRCLRGVCRREVLIFATGPR